MQQMGRLTVLCPYIAVNEGLAYGEVDERIKAASKLLRFLKGLPLQ